jgi:hypothetical protein
MRRYVEQFEDFAADHNGAAIIVVSAIFLASLAIGLALVL